MMFVREIKQIYSVGQQEPKEEVYAPQSRSYSAFLKRRVQAFALKILERYDRRINFMELRRYFTIFNEQVLRKTLKEINVEIDRNQDAYLPLDESIEDKIKNLITPENVCQYEAAEFGQRRLQRLGIRRITNANKISFASNKFCSEERNLEYKRYAKIIEEEVLCSPWNLSQSFITNQQINGMMILKGIGDPSRGNGGYSYLKLPLKMSQDSLNKEVVVNKSVTGTDSDLRKLSKEQIHDMLRNLGFGSAIGNDIPYMDPRMIVNLGSMTEGVTSAESQAAANNASGLSAQDRNIDVSKLSRWQGVKILRDLSSRASTLGVAGNFKKFARGSRMTSKMQRENYQKQINDIFDKQMDILSSDKPDIVSDSDVDTVNEDETNLKSMMKNSKNSNVKAEEKINTSRKALYDENSLNEMKTYLECNEEKEVKSIYDLPNYNNEFRNHLKEYYDKFKEGSHECVVLKKVIRSIDPTTNEENVRVVYVFDERHIKSFKKRVDKCRSRRRSKPKKPTNRSVYGAQKSRPDNAIVSLRLNNHSEMDIQSVRSGVLNERSTRNKETTNNGKIIIPMTLNDEESKGNREEMDDDYGKIVLDTGDINGERKMREDAPKKAKKPKRKTSEENMYLNGPKRQNTCSRRRQNTPLSQFNEILTNIIDNCITFDTTRMFHVPVKKAEAPNYYDVITNPMDLSTMKAKTKRCEYNTIDEFQNDMSLIKSNSEKFNGPIHFVTTQAGSIVDRAQLLVQSDSIQLEELEVKVKEDQEV